MNHPETSVVIRTFNEERFLPNLLAAIEQQAYRDHETIVVDSGSLDRTREIAAQKADMAKMRSDLAPLTNKSSSCVNKI